MDLKVPHTKQNTMKTCYTRIKHRWYLIIYNRTLTGIAHCVKLQIHKIGSFESVNKTRRTSRPLNIP